MVRHAKNWHNCVLQCIEDISITHDLPFFQASAAGVTVVNPGQQPPTIRLGSPIRGGNLDPIQEMSAPKYSKQRQALVSNSLPLNGGSHSSAALSGSSPLNNNNNKQNGGGPVQRVRRESLGSRSSRPTTPSGQVRALNLNNLSKSHPSVELPTEQASPVDLLNSMEKKVRPKSFWASWWRF